MANSGEVIAPKFMAAFQCVGGACEETCCADFLVDVDRATFKTYMAVKDPVLGGKLRTLVRKRVDATPEAFGRIALTASGECPFLDPQRLCSIQNALGESALSHTCSAFPRARWARDGQSYLGGKLSCPEAARLCVSSADAMDLGPGPAPAAASDPDSAARLAAHAAVADALRDPTLPVWKAILLAGVVANDVLADAGAEAALDVGAVRDFAAKARSELAGAGFELGDQTLQQLKLLIDIVLSASARCNASRNRFPHIAQTALDAIFEGAEDFGGAAANYRRLYRDRFQAFDAAHDHALRNYVLNYVFNNQLVLSGPAFSQFQGLAVRFGIMRLLLVGLAGSRPQGLSIADYAAVVSSASRIVDHDAWVGADIHRALDVIEPRSFSLAARMVIPPG